MRFLIRHIRIINADNSNQMIHSIGKMVKVVYQKFKLYRLLKLTLPQPTIPGAPKVMGILTYPVTQKYNNEGLFLWKRMVNVFTLIILVSITYIECSLQLKAENFQIIS